MLRRNGGHAARQKVVSAVARLDFHQLALLAQVRHVLGEDELHAPVRAL